MKQSEVPRHIGFIMDGNRRFAKRLMIKPWKGHEWGAEKLKKVLEWCKDIGVKEATFYAFSIQNFDRPKKEFDFLMKLAVESADNLLKNEKFLSNEHGVKVNFIGRLDMFPEKVQERMRKIMDVTKNNKKHILNFAVAYGGREEVIDAVKRIAEKAKEGNIDIDRINEETFSKELYIKDEPDLIIRTGGEMRISNFLLWQSSYSEWIFVDKMWPEFEQEDFLKCIQEYGERERRFGQ